MNKRLFTRAENDPDRLGTLVAARLSLDEDAARALVEKGAVAVDGARHMDPALRVAAGARVTVRSALVPGGSALGGSGPAGMKEPRVVLEDDLVLILDKPSGMPSQATRADAQGALDAFARRRAPGARLLHRLDRDASGLVLFAVGPEAAAPLQAALEGGRIERAYRAVVTGRVGEPGTSGTIALRIARDSHDPRKRTALPEAAPGGKPALTRYRVLGFEGGMTGLALELETGRTHQLRVHLAALGHPIVGDTIYGGAPAERLCLHAVSLSLPHPRSGERVRVTSPLPEALTARAPFLTKPVE